MKKILPLILLLALTTTTLAYGFNIYINNKAFIGNTYTYEEIVYVEAKELLNFMNVSHSCTDTTLSIEDEELQEKFYSIAVWVDYGDGRGNVISVALKDFANIMGGNYNYNSDTGIVDVYTFSRSADTNTQTQPVTAPEQPQSTSNSSPDNSITGGVNVNPFNTTKILNDANNAAGALEGQNNSGGF